MDNLLFEIVLDKKDINSDYVLIRIYSDDSCKSNTKADVFKAIHSEFMGVKSISGESLPIRIIKESGES